MSVEIWKNIEDTNGFYQVSSLGQVKSIDRYVRHSSGGRMLRRGRLMQGALDTYGYVQVRISCAGRSTLVLVHRLVAKAFLPPSDLPEVNHIDLNRRNNVVTNLEWVTHHNNMRHSTASGIFNPMINPRRRHKLDPELAAAIHMAYWQEGLTLPAIGQKFGIGKVTVWKVVQEVAWKGSSLLCTWPHAQEEIER